MRLNLVYVEGKGESVTSQLGSDELTCREWVTKVVKILKTIYIFNFVFVS